MQTNVMFLWKSRFSGVWVAAPHGFNHGVVKTDDPPSLMVETGLHRPYKLFCWFDQLAICTHFPGNF